MRTRLVLATLLATLACAGEPPGGTGQPTAGPETRLPADADASAWLTIHDPEHAGGGYTLATWERRTPVLLAADGKVVHAWPQARFGGRARLLPDCGLRTISLDGSVREYGWDGELRWEFQLPDELLHHDLLPLPNGNTLLISLPRPTVSDDLLEVTPDGEVVWRWRSADHLQPWFDRSPDPGDVSHLNSVDELPPNPWFDAGDERFRPGNLLLSARNLNALFIIDRRTGAVTWSFSEGLDLQHDARMIPPGMPGDGHILVFDNGDPATPALPRSEIVEIHPPSGEVTWRFSTPGFYSRFSGVQRPLGNGNVFVASSHGRRIFEVTRTGEIVWQWAPPFEVLRPARYPVDHCPRLAALPVPEPRPVAPPPGYLHIDPESYDFARLGAVDRGRIDGVPRRLLRQPQQCRRLLLPQGAEAALDYGLQAGTTRGARFAARLTVPNGEPAGLLDERVPATGGEVWRQTTVSLAAWSLREIELCLSATGLDPAAPPPEGAVWAAPRIVGDRTPEDPDPFAGLTPEERAARRAHLEALGYVQ